MLGGLVTVVAPTISVVSIADVKAHARIDISDDDLQVQRKVSEATALVEDYCGLSLLTQTLDWTFDRFPCQGAMLYGSRVVPVGRTLDLPRAPLASVTSVTTTSEDGSATVMSSSDYYLDIANHPGRLCLKSSASWPTDVRCFSGITVRFVSGWTSASDVPAPIVEAVLHIVAWSYGFRGDDVVSGISSASSRLPATVYEKLAPYRISLGIG